MWYNMSAYTELCKNVADYFEAGYNRWKTAYDSGDPIARYPSWTATYENNLKAACYWRKKEERVTSF